MVNQTPLYRVGLKWWLGIPLMADAQGVTVLCPGCGTQVDAHGDHLLCCPRNNFTHRHTAVQDGLVSILNDASQPYSREVVIPNSTSGQQTFCSMVGRPVWTPRWT